MAHRQRSPSLPETLDRPDAGFMAAAGAYVAAVLVALSIALAVAMGASTAAVVGSLSTAITVGLITGGVAAGRVRGLPERLGRGRRLALPFVVPLLFAAVAVLALVIPSAPTALAIGTGLGAAITLATGSVIASMSRTRYTKAMTPNDPIATVPLLNRTRNLSMIGSGIVCFVLAVAFARSGMNQVPLTFGATGLFALLYGLSLRAAVRGDDKGSGRLLGWLEYDPFFETVDTELLPTVEVHEVGVTITHPGQRRFVPWERVRDVRLTDRELRIERPRRRDIRCALAVIDDLEGVRETIERARTGT